jgi:uracil-DNA glycosylase family 4
MLTSKQIRMLELLDKQVSNCQRCGLYENGTAIPHWTPESQYVIIGEAPGANEVREQTPFIGPAGKILTENLNRAGFHSKDFLIINTVQCRPVRGNSNGKPNETQIKKCQSYLRKYLKVVKPEKILCLGNYAKYIFTGNLQGILRERGHFMEGDIGDGYVFPVMFTVHPAYCIYNREEGEEYLQKDITLFKKRTFERRFDEWLLSEDDFKI